MHDDDQQLCAGPPEGETGRVLALDIGERTMGMAISDEQRIIAQGLDTIRRTRMDKDLAALAEVIREHEIVRIVVGWPLRLNGKPGIQTQKVAKVAAAIEARFGLPIDRWDERLTTVAAQRALIEGNVRREKRRQVVDKVAATLILQGYLERRST
ncbi:MAG: Holliday junction resolvase RuvX [Bradymonadia bacterium]